MIRKLKTSHIFLLALSAMLMAHALPSWGLTTTYYAKLTTQVSDASPSGSGKVYAGTTTTAGTYDSSSSSSESQSSTTQNEGKTFYAFAQAEDGYYFKGWANSNSSTTIASENNPYAVTVKCSSSSSSSPTTTTVYAVFAENPAATVTYTASAGGSYTATYSDGKITMNPGGSSQSKSSKETVSLSATPAEDYKFLRWVKEVGGVKSGFAFAATTSASFAADATVYAEFIPKTYAVFSVGGALFSDLNEANTFAAGSKNIIVVEDGELIAGNYTISSGVTLVVPYESTGSKSITKPVALTNSELPISLYRKLTLGPGVNITLKGAIAVAAQVQSGNNTHNPCGFPVGPVGCLDMSKGGHIDVENGGAIYCWGFIKGQDYLDGNNTQNVGTITAKSGATIKECYGTADWGGGSYAMAVGSNSKSYRIYPFQGYFVQNIEVPLRLEYGAKDYLYTNVYASSSQNEITDIPFIGNNSGVLFKINSTNGAVSKWYDATTDHLVVEMEGDASLDNLQMTIYITINANEFDLPILSNMHIKLKNCALTLSAPMKLQAGAILEVPAGSSLTLKSKLYVYDHDQWGAYVQKKYFKPLPAILTQFRSRGDGSINTLDDAKIIADGNIIMASGGGLYTTASGADVMGNNGGTIQWESSLPANSTTYGYTNGTGVTGSNFSSTLTAEYCDGAECTPAKGHNENDSYTAAKAGAVFFNVHGRWFAYPANTEKANHTYDFTYLNAGADVTTEAIYWVDAAGDGHWNNATTDGVTQYQYTWIGTEEEAGVTAYYSYKTYDQDGNEQTGWVKLTQIGSSENFGGSDNNMYVYVDDKWQSIGSTDSECLYTVSGEKKALVGNSLIAISVNNSPTDGAWHATADATKYYVDLSGGSCIWSPATKVAGVEKVYVVNGTTYMRYDQDGTGEDWMAVEYEEPFYYTVDEQNLRTYYEYNATEVKWQLATPKLSVTSNGATKYYYFFKDGMAAANASYNPTVTLLADCEEQPTTEIAISSTMKSTSYTIDLNGHTVTMTRAISGTSTASTANRFLNITTAMAVKIMDSSAEQNGQIRCIATGNAYARGITVSAGSLTLESGKLYVENSSAYASNSSARAYGVYVPAGTTFTMNGGEIATASEYYSYGVLSIGATSNPGTFNMNGGVINANGYYGTQGVYATGNVNMTGGTINAKTGPMFSKTGGNQYAYGIMVTVSANATASSSYHGKLTMTGGEINAYAVSNYAYGVYVNAGTANKSGGTANVASAEAVINGGVINAESKTTAVYGVFVYGGPNTGAADSKTVINGGTINAKGTATVYGIFVNAGVADLSGAKLYGIAEINDCNSTATATSSTNAYGLYVTASSRMMNETTYSQVSASNKKTWYSSKTKATSSQDYKYQEGYHACGAKCTVNGGAFTGNSKTYGAYGAYCAASMLRGAEDDTEAKAVGLGELTIKGGTFNANSGSYNAYAVFSSGTTKIEGGTFNPTSTTYGAYGAYADRGTMTITGGNYNANATTTTAVGIGATGWIDGGRGIHSHAVVTVDGVTVNAKCKTKDSAFGVMATGTTAELTAAKYAARSASDRNYYFTDATNALIANYYRYRIGVYEEGGELTVNGGTFNVETATTTAIGAYCSQSALVHTTEVGCYTKGNGTLTINGGTFISKTNGTTTAECVRSLGNTTINGGTFTATAKTTTAHGVRVIDGETTINGGTFNSIATTTTAYGVFVNAEVETNYGYTREAVANITGGTFNVETKGGSTAYGLYVNGSKKASFKPSKMASASTVTEDLALAATATVTDGTFNVKSSSNNTVFSVYVVGTQTQGTATASPKCTVEGGKFNINGATTGSAIVNNSATTDNFAISGGHYSATHAYLTKYVVSPKTVVDCDHEDLKATYPYEVAEAYKVTFKNGSTTLQEGYVKNGATPVYSGATPTKAADAQYTYTFSGWSPTISAVAGADQEYIAQFDQSTRSYTITWQDENGTELSHEVLEYGAMPSHADLTKAEDAQYTYTWKGWDKTIVAVASDATYKSLGFTATLRSYTITFQNEDGTTLQESDVEYGTVPAYTGAEPTKAADATYTYSFEGWTPELVAVVGEATYTATYMATPLGVASVNGMMYPTWPEAVAAANATSGASVVLIADIADATAQTLSKSMTIDLNGHELSGAENKLLDINGSGITVTITDNSAEKTGVISSIGELNGAWYTIYLTNGTLNLNGGNIYGKNTTTYNKTSAPSVETRVIYIASSKKFIMNSGSIVGEGNYKVTGLYSQGTSTINPGAVLTANSDVSYAYPVYTNKGTTTVNGGELHGTSAKNYAFGAYLRSGTFNINGGTFLGTANVGGTANAYGFYVYGSTSNKANLKNATFKAEALTAKATNAVGVYNGGVMTIDGCTIESTTASSTSYGIQGAHTTTIGGNTQVTARGSSTVHGIMGSGGTTTVNACDVKAIASAHTARGICAWATTNSSTGAATVGTVIVNDGAQIYAETQASNTNPSNAAMGLYVASSGRTIADLGAFAAAATATVNGGTFEAKAAASTKAYAIYATGTTTKSLDGFDDASATSMCTILGGKFKTSGTTPDQYAVNTASPADHMIIQGGHYSNDSGLSGYVTTPYRVFDCDHEELKATYPYEVADASYTVSFDANGGSGTMSDLVLVYGVAQQLTTNAFTHESYSITYYEEDPYAPPTFDHVVAATFTGWNTQADGSGTTYTDEQSVSNLTTAGGAVTLYAQWTATESLPEPAVRDGYEFDGWYDAADGGNLIGAKGASYSPSRSCTLYGHWHPAMKGDPLDIVDWTATEITINASAFASSGWPYTINGVVYQQKTKSAESDKLRESDRTLKLSVAALTADEDYSIVITNKDGALYNRNSYKVPHIDNVTGLKNNSVVYLHEGTYAITAAAVKDIYVAHNATLRVNSALTISGKMVLRTTAWESAVLEKNAAITGKVYYSRIVSDKGYYQFGLPLPFNTANVVLSNGATCTYGTTWLLKSYNEATRAENGADDQNWNAVAAGMVAGGKGYEMYSNSAYYREYYFPVNLAQLTNATATVAYTADGAAGPQHAGWNALCSPLTGVYTIPSTIDPADGLKICRLEPEGFYTQYQPTEIMPAVPFYYQASANGQPITFGGSEMSFPQAVAARGMQAETRTQWLQLSISNGAEADRAIIYLNSTKFTADYDPGYDVEKLSTAGSRPIIYTSLACGNLAFAAVPDEVATNRLPLTVYATQNEPLTLSLADNDWMDRLDAVYLIDEERGSTIDLMLSDYQWEAAAGTTAGRFFLLPVFRSPSTATDVSEVEMGSEYSLTVVGGNLVLTDLVSGTTVRLYDAAGRLLLAQTATSETMSMQVSADGVYLLQVGNKMQKVVLNK